MKKNSNFENRLSHFGVIPSIVDSIRWFFIGRWGRRFYLIFILSFVHSNSHEITFDNAHSYSFSFVCYFLSNFHFQLPLIFNFSRVKIEPHVTTARKENIKFANFHCVHNKSCLWFCCFDSLLSQNEERKSNNKKKQKLIWYEKHDDFFFLSFSGSSSARENVSFIRLFVRSLGFRYYNFDKRSGRNARSLRRQKSDWNSWNANHNGKCENEFTFEWISRVSFVRCCSFVFRCVYKRLLFLRCCRSLRFRFQCILLLFS